MKTNILETFSDDFVIRLMPLANKTYIHRYWNVVYMALEEAGLDYKEMMLMSLATIATEVGNFDIRIREYQSKWNTDPGAHPFNRYDNRADLGNTGEPDGLRYRGGGAIQLTGRDNYRRIGGQMGVPLEDKPELISHPIVSARALALFLKNKKDAIDFALAHMDLRKARKLVNGGSHGLVQFQGTYVRGLSMAGGA